MPSKVEWNRLIHGVAKILHIRQGHQQEWITIISMEKYFDLHADTYCRFPHQPVVGRNDDLKVSCCQGQSDVEDQEGKTEQP